MSRLVIVGGGVVERSGGHYNTRSQLLEYLLEFTLHYDEVIWAVRLSDSEDYISQIDEERIKLDVINKDGESFFSLKGVYRQLRQYFKFSGLLVEGGNVIVSGYSLVLIPYILISRIRGCRCLFYLGSDPVLNQSLRSDTAYGKCIASLNLWLLPVSLKCASHVAVRGEGTLNQCKRWTKNISMSKPLISYREFQLPVKSDVATLGEIAVLFVGKIEKNKGLDILIDSYARMVRELENTDLKATLTIVGSGTMVGRYTSQVRELGPTGDGIKFTGFIDDSERLGKIFSNHDIFVIPSVWAEGYPRVVDEAMARGLPVICSRIGGLKDGLEDGDVHFVGPGSVSQLSDALYIISTNQKYRKDLSKRSLAISAQMLKTTAAEQHLELLSGSMPNPSSAS